MARLTAAHIMTPRVVTATPEMTIAQVAKVMNKFRIGGLPVLKNDKLIGIITERCIMKKVIEKDMQPSKITVKNVMAKEPVTAGPSDTITRIANLMAKRDVSRIPIVNRGKLVGIVTNKDILQHGSILMDVILEQARVKGPLDPHCGSVAFGKCEACGQSGDLAFRGEQFLCEDCGRQILKDNELVSED